MSFAVAPATLFGEQSVPLRLPPLPRGDRVLIRPQPPPLLPGVVLQAAEVILLVELHSPPCQALPDHLGVHVHAADVDPPAKVL